MKWSHEENLPGRLTDCHFVVEVLDNLLISGADPGIEVEPHELFDDQVCHHQACSLQNFFREPPDRLKKEVRVADSARIDTEIELMASRSQLLESALSVGELDGGRVVPPARGFMPGPVITSSLRPLYHPGSLYNDSYWHHTDFPITSKQFRPAANFIWERIKMQPDSYTMSPQEFAVFNVFRCEPHFQNDIARRAISRYWQSRVDES